MDRTQTKILQDLKTTKEASVIDIMDATKFYPNGGRDQVRQILNAMVKQGTIKRRNPTKYRIVNKIENTQIKVF